MYDAHIKESQHRLRRTIRDMGQDVPSVHDHYHKRPNADSVRSKCDVGQINEVLAKVLCNNMCVMIRATHELGVEATLGAGSRIEPELFI